MIDFDGQLETPESPADTALDSVIHAMVTAENDRVRVHVDAMLARHADDMRATMALLARESRRFRAG